ncbi:alpha/beta hydrolase [Mesorhizobium sp. AR07]|uniref:alpha/beta hydrolase n=1 Tax=Mesorhizobium sp. AR07 TaxID=2865838 RepID=UPI002160D45E|nr:alpha/beta hydrolase [Mesorhizobium sp. AR07]UVK44874.1 alpha/beta hydrolase [Mesorhizobium sp. AR07]
MTEETSQDGALQRDLAFRYRLFSPAASTGECVFLLHGSGVDETTLVPLAREIAPRAVLIAVRGRLVQEDGFRWFARITPTRFEQQSIRTETDAFAGFIADATTRHGLDLSRTAFLGYSNGANLVSSLMLLHPGLVERAALLRPMPVLDDVPATDLSNARVLIIAGAADLTYAPFAPALVTLLSQHRAELDARIVPSGHEFGGADAAIVRQWLKAVPAPAE